MRHAPSNILVHLLSPLIHLLSGLHKTTTTSTCASSCYTSERRRDRSWSVSLYQIRHETFYCRIVQKLLT